MNSYLRIIDANFNRAKEALRVCEDLARFLLNRKPLAAAYKKRRHELSALLLKFPASYRRLVSSRDSVRDVGRNYSIKDARGKIKWQDIMIANMKRSQEAVRVLEEFSRILAPKLTAPFERLRFHLYELERISLQKF